MKTAILGARVRAIRTDGGVRRGPGVTTVQDGDVGRVVGVEEHEYAVVFWPTRYTTTVEHVGRDVEVVD